MTDYDADASEDRSIMKRNILRIFPLLLVIICLTFGAVGADYSFRVPRAETVVEVNSDGTLNVFVEYEFENLGQKLDYIDIGLPNNNYKLSEIEVRLNGELNNNIKVTKADYDQTGLKYGISLEMGSESIPSGGSAVVNVLIPNLRKNLNEATSETVDDQTVDFVGFQFSPNYFSSKFVEGSTAYSFIEVFPLGAGDGDVYYYTPVKWSGPDEPDAWIDEDGRVVYEWYDENANIHTAYTFGGKFPKSVMTDAANIVVSKSSGTSSSSSGGFDWADFFGTLTMALTCILGPVLFIFFTARSIVKSFKQDKVRTGKYFPPQIKTDGEGIKRGLTAVEAAIVLETDLERVISMILYGLAKKEVVKVNSMDPLDVEIVNPLPENLHDYEKDFIAALQETNEGKRKSKMRDSMHRLILATSKKVEGFNLQETRDYYKSICDKAWAQVEAADTPELKSQLLGDNFGWAMLQDEPEKRVESTFSGADFYPPYWWWRVDPGYRRPVYHSYPSGSSVSSGSSDDKRSSSPSTSSSKPSAMPVLPGAMFARSITRSAQNLGKSLTGNMNAFKSSIKGKTNPEPVYSSSSSHRHGGGGSSHSSCACACACDSCACACAGGGR